MNWYAAHLVLYVKYKGTGQDHFPFWENIILLQADSEDEAFEKAEARGREEAGDDDGTFRWEGQPATWIFAGVRELTCCEDSGNRPQDGTEITFLEMQAGSVDDIHKLMDGKPVSLKLVEKFSEPVEV